jgi:tRNA (guanine-N7-)-methyltransferase
VRKKIKRFEENKELKNIIESGKPLFEEIKGQWNEQYFTSSQPISLEIGCGNGEYTVGLAEKQLDRNFIGIDIKGDRLYVGSTQAIENGLDNVGFLRTSVHDLASFFGENEVEEIWITFPDPRPKDRDIKRRLTFPRFLNLYKQIMREGGYLKFKTDNTALFEYTLELFKSEFKVSNLEYTFDLYQSSLMSDHHGIKTKYERIWSEKGEKIKYLKCQLK